MVRGVNSFNPTNGVSGFLLKSKAKNICKVTELPTKVALGGAGILGVASSIKEPGLTDQFVMKCSNYDDSDNDGFDYCSPLFP